MPARPPPPSTPTATARLWADEGSRPPGSSSAASLPNDQTRDWNCSGIGAPERMWGAGTESFRVTPGVFEVMKRLLFTALFGLMLLAGPAAARPRPRERWTGAFPVTASSNSARTAGGLVLGGRRDAVGQSGRCPFSGPGNQGRGRGQVPKTAAERTGLSASADSPTEVSLRDDQPGRRDRRPAWLHPGRRPCAPNGRKGFWGALARLKRNGRPDWSSPATA